MHIHICTYVHMYIYTYKQINKKHVIHILFLHIIYIYIYIEVIYIYIYIYICVCVCVHVCIYIYIYIYHTRAPDICVWHNTNKKLPQDTDLASVYGAALKRDMTGIGLCVDTVIYANIETKCSPRRNPCRTRAGTR